MNKANRIYIDKSKINYSNLDMMIKAMRIVSQAKIKTWTELMNSIDNQMMYE